MTRAIARPATSQYRWIICSLLFFATVIAYVDRGVVGYLEKYLEGIFHFDSVQYSYMTTAFQIAYAIGLVTAGWLTDRLGTRKGFALAIGLWSLAAMTPGAATGVWTFCFAMFFLGLGEAANFPACNKTIAEWFPKKERALAFGIFNSGANIGNIAVPMVVPALVFAVGWRAAFVVVGALGLVWLCFWLLIYRRPEDHPRVSAEELAFIESDPPEKTEKVPWARLLPLKETWAFSIAKMLTDPIWWFYLFWLPRFLQETFHTSISTNRTPIVVVYLISIVGSVGGGLLSSAMLARGSSLNAARKTALLICALMVLPILYAPYSKSLWVVVALVGLAAAGHQGWSANLFTLASDLFPKAAVASVTGIGGMAGAIAGAGFQLVAGYVAKSHPNCAPLFIVAGLAYISALAVIQILSPKLAPAKLD
jgi:ACS family hexuronate transporter-like MFS transporter